MLWVPKGEVATFSVFMISNVSLYKPLSCDLKVLTNIMSRNKRETAIYIYIHMSNFKNIASGLYHLTIGGPPGGSPYF